ncbi:MAG: 4Fe-4S dicluster domain-containing protein [Polyangiaceae bacterium]|nr:4Fe-4S dicluster domain-containing protein [Polyangiaceae bacterium]
MIARSGQGYIETVPNRCRTCYTCVRECPAKAIRIQDGQAQVVPSRCIVCGNCVRVCSRKAKRVVDTVPPLEALLAQPGRRAAALIAPSFPAEFVGVEAARLVGALRELGFAFVVEVAFGADLVAQRYAELMAGRPSGRHIATTCPAVTCFVEKQHPELVPELAPLVSPMVAIARTVHHDYGDDVATVFIGPCAAKKMEADASKDVDVAITFRELRTMFAERDIRPAVARPSAFDPPHPHLGVLFPLSRGMLQAAGLHEDLTTLDVVAADGRPEFVDTIREFATGSLDARLLEVLCCTGCVMGVGMTGIAPLSRRRANVAAYLREAAARCDKRQWHEDLRRLGGLDLSRTFMRDDQRLSNPTEGELTEILRRMGKSEPDDELDCGACGYDTCREHARAIWLGLAESEMCLPYTIDSLHTAFRQLAESHGQLQSAQAALMQSEKLASMGQLAAGIAHEVNNPLGVVLMYSHLLRDEVPEDSPLHQDLTLVAEQAERCRRIVAGLLDFARQNRVLYQDCDTFALADKALRAAPPPDNVQLVKEYAASDPKAELDPDQVVQVLTNLFTNSYAAMEGGGVLTVSVADAESDIVLSVTDTGRGIPEQNRSKIFDPFFTTKTMGHGTGLGLAVVYGIIKMHRGQISVASRADPSAGPTGTTFTMKLPRRGRAE